MGCGASTPPPELTPEEKNGIASKACQDLLVMCAEQASNDAKSDETWDLEKYVVTCPGHDKMIAQLAVFYAEAQVKQKMAEMMDGGMAEKMAGKALALGCTAAIKACQKTKETLEGELKQKFSEEAKKISKQKEFKSFYIKVAQEHNVKGALELCTSAQGPSVTSYFHSAGKKEVLNEELTAITAKGLNSGMFGGALPKASKNLISGWNEVSDMAQKVDLTLKKIDFSIEEYMRDETVRVFQMKMQDKEKEIRAEPHAVKKKQSKCIPTAFGNKDHSKWLKIKGIDKLPL